MPFRIFLRVVRILVLCSILQVNCRSLYRHPLNCALDEYYNPATHHCEGCQELCQPNRDTLGEQCSRLCPGYQSLKTVAIPLHDHTPLTNINDQQKQNKDKDLESIWRYMHIMAAAIAVTVCVTVMLVVCVVQLRKENKRLMKQLGPDHEEVQDGHPGHQAVGGTAIDPPGQSAAPMLPPTTATQQEIEPLIKEPGKPVPEEGDGGSCVPIAPSSRVPIYSTDTNPHDLNDPLREDHGPTPTIVETEI
ncbi:uncharacterized protein LOC144863913 [Branchiostoma floridae x Branchiostoma japonicum]